ncbi:MAG: gamma-glutamyl-gamma-aminobutyrate hydrolase family protein [Gemmatimonadaceae bacterium]
MSRTAHDPAPVIALTTATEIVRGIPRVRVNERYTSALVRAGALPVAVPPLNPDAADALLDRVDGLVLTGGEDVESRWYGARPHPKAEAPNPERDRWELALARAARDRRLPTLAICRGMQIANVEFGGSLIQDIASERPDAIAHARDDARTTRVHAVVIDPASRLARALGADRIVTNSMHHQAIDRAGDGLRVVARAEDGIIEAVEWNGDDWWMIGVQWHPEELDDTPDGWDRALFAAFAAAVSASSASAFRPVPGA